MNKKNKTGLKFLYLKAVSLFLVASLAANVGHAAVVVTDQAAFQLRTGATNATGDLPDLGVIEPGTGATVGAVTFSAGEGSQLAIGTHAGAVGVLDWYPQLPGNDIKLSIEDLRVDFAAPVSAFGIIMVEPARTMPPEGGTPVDSPYVINLYNGLTLVDRAQFNAPDDVITFLGIISNVPFTRAELIDTTGNLDDEYFGQVFSAPAIQAQTQSISLDTLLSTIPNGTGTFTGFPGGAALSGTDLIFSGSGIGSQSGVYVSSPLFSQLVPVADLTTPIPAGAGNFIAFSALDLVGLPVEPCRTASFIGSGDANQVGIYTTNIGSSACATPLARLVDTGTAIPNGTGSFTAFPALDLVASPGDPIRPAVFIGAGSAGQMGIYSANITGGTSPTPLTALADTSTVIPGGSGTFTGFAALDLVAPPTETCRTASFIGTGDANQSGIYSRSYGASCPTSLTRLVDTTTAIPGGSGTFTGFTALSATEQTGAAASSLVFIGRGTNGQQGVYRVTAPPVNVTRIADLTTPIPGGTGNFTGFVALTAYGDHTAFMGLGNDGQRGLYVASTLTKVMAVGDSVEGRTVADLRVGKKGLGQDKLAFAAVFTDGSEAIMQNFVRFQDAHTIKPTLVIPASRDQKLVSIDLRDVLRLKNNVAVKVKSIRQDEPVKGNGAGNTCPDGKGIGKDSASVRAETVSAAQGGRVYHIGYNLTPKTEPSSSGEITACIVNNKASKTCEDQGPLFDSTVCP
jgi:hypothetical protein